MASPLVIDGKRRDRYFLGSLALSLMCAVGAVKLSFDPPLIQTPDTIAQERALLEAGTPGTVKHPAAWAKALTLLLSGGSLALGFAAKEFSKTEPEFLSSPTLEAIADPKRPEKTTDLTDKEYVNEGRAVVDKLTGLFIDCPWLEELCDTRGSANDLLIIIGQPGKGKSSFAMSVALCRVVMGGDPLWVFDSHADTNLRRGNWCSGNIVGLTNDGVGKERAGDFGHLPYKEQWQRARATLTAELASGEESHATVIYDELRELTNQDFSSEEIAAFYDEYSAWRKRGDKNILLWHDDSKAGAGLHHLPKDSPMLRTLLDYAAVLNLNAVEPTASCQRKAKQAGEKYTDRAAYKPAGKPYSREHFETVAFPEFLQPGRIMAALGGAAEYFDVRPTGYRDPGLYARRQEIRGRIQESLTGLNNGGLKSALQRVYDTPAAQHWLERNEAEEADISEGFGLDGMPSRHLFTSLLKYLNDPRRASKVDENGFFEMRFLYANWGNKTDASGVKRFTSTEALREWLAEYNAAGFGEWGNDSRTLWRGRYKTADF